MSEYDFAEISIQSKQKLLDLIEEIKKDHSLVKRDFWPALTRFMYLGNTKLESEARIAWYKLQPKSFLFIKIYPSASKCCLVLNAFIEQIDAELDNEKKVGNIAETLSEVRLLWPSGEAGNELEEKIRENAAKIARIIS